MIRGVFALEWTAAAALAAGTWAILGVRRAVRGSTLAIAWLTALLAMVSWWVAWAVSRLVADTVLADRCWYIAAVLALAPFVQVLGARRPVAKSWTGFVIVPMVAVLGLPVATSLGVDVLDRFEIETPTLIGFLLVLVMGTGNYFGTRFTFPVLLVAAGLAFLVVSGSRSRPDWFPGETVVRSAAAILLGVGLLSATYCRPSPMSGSPVEAAWAEFRDTFGIVWAKRVMDRVNESLTTAGLETRLDLDGFTATTSEHDRAEAERVTAETFSWLLKRFVDETWAARFGLALRPDRSPEPRG